MFFLGNKDEKYYVFFVVFEGELIFFLEVEVGIEEEVEFEDELLL